MAIGISFTASDLRVLLNDQELTLEVYEGGAFVSDWKSSVEIDKNGVLKIITYSDTGIDIFDNKYRSGTPVSVSNGGSVNIDINDYPDGIYIDMTSAPPVEEYTYTLNITGFAAEKITQLKPFLQSIANAIRTKKGTGETINAQNFVSEIESIESGGGNWTEEQGHDGSINFTIRYTDVYVMDFSGTPWLHHSKMDANQTINYTNAKMILIYVDIPNNITTTNLNNIEILSTNNHSYIILKPTGENFSCDIEVEGP